VRYERDQFVAGHLRMADLACKCSEACSHKALDDVAHARSIAFFRAVGQLIDEYPLHVRVTNALRCPAHNLEVGGAPDSPHVHRCAIDLIPEGPCYDLALAAEAANFFSGILVYPHMNMLHLDVHPSDRVVRGHSFGKGNEHFLGWGNRDGSPLYVLTEWNCDETLTPPGYIRATLGGNSEVGRCPSK